MEEHRFDQWARFVALAFRTRYLQVARRSFPDLAGDLPLTRGAGVTVVQVNAGEAVHFLFEAAPRRGDATCRHATVVPPGGWSVADWAMLAERQYKRFVERTAGVPRPEAHFVVFPLEDDGPSVAALAADEAVRAHAREAGGPR